MENSEKFTQSQSNLLLILLVICFGLEIEFLLFVLIINQYGVVTRSHCSISLSIDCFFAYQSICIKVHSLVNRLKI